MIEHKHGIIVIKNDKNEFLQYYDNRWNSFLFLNCKVSENFDNQYIITDLVNKLKIPVTDLECNLLTDKIHTKYSESAKREKKYHHYFYNINIKNIPNIMQEKEFYMDDIKFKWYSLDELENDERIQQVNSDIVGFVKELNII